MCSINLASCVGFIRRAKDIKTQPLTLKPSGHMRDKTQVVSCLLMVTSSSQLLRSKPWSHTLFLLHTISNPSTNHNASAFKTYPEVYHVPYLCCNHLGTKHQRPMDYCSNFLTSLPASALYPPWPFILNITARILIWKINTIISCYSSLKTPRSSPCLSV